MPVSVFQPIAETSFLSAFLDRREQTSHAVLALCLVAVPQTRLPSFAEAQAVGSEPIWSAKS